METAIIAFAALAASLLTLFSGFGLGTLLMPAFALFFPVPVAVAATAVVHLANNLFKFILLGRLVDWPVVLRFGLPAALSAVAGALLLAELAAQPPVLDYILFGQAVNVTMINLVIGLLILAFAILELSPAFAVIQVPRRYLAAGGVLSGFFGGLSGNQGALRSAFLIKAGLDKQGFVATGVVCSVIVDTVRIVVYGLALHSGGFGGFDSALTGTVALAMLMAFAGAYLGVRLLGKVTLRFVQLAVAVMMMIVGLGLVSGLL